MARPLMDRLLMLKAHLMTLTKKVKVAATSKTKKWWARRTTQNKTWMNPQMMTMMTLLMATITMTKLTGAESISCQSRSTVWTFHSV